MQIIRNLFGAFFITFASIYNLYKLLNKKIPFKKLKFNVTFLSLMFISIINYFNTNLYIRIILITVSLIVVCKILFNKNLKIIIMTAIYSQIMIMISEFIYILGISIILQIDENTLINSFFGTLVTNLSVSLISIIIININFVQRFYKFLINSIEKINIKYFISLSIFILVLFNILSMTVYYNLNFKYILIFNTLMISLNFLIIIYSFSTQNKYNKVYDKYNTTLNSLKEYEDILDRYRVSNHENKNQLLTIRNMIPKSDKKTISYIDKIIENKLRDNDKVMFEVSIIPAGGLRGLIYSKVLTMKNLNIEYELEISNSIKTVDLISLDDALMLDICQIIGVYLDNAIEEVQKLEEKYINIEMYIEDKELIIEISNNYKCNIDIEKIEDKGYTSKGNGHGYGLSLTRKIIENNKKLSNQKKISKESFTQILKIKM